MALLGHDVAEGTVAKYMGHRRSGSPSWLTFLRNHLPETAACDFFTVPTATFRVLYCFLVLSHDRRRIVHFNVTTNPSAEWTSQQIVEAFPGDWAIPKFLVRDRDGIYGSYFRRRVQNMGIREIITSRKSPRLRPLLQPVAPSPLAGEERPRSQRHRAAGPGSRYRDSPGRRPSSPVQARGLRVAGPTIGSRRSAADVRPVSDFRR